MLGNYFEDEVFEGLSDFSFLFAFGESLKVQRVDVENLEKLIIRITLEGFEVDVFKTFEMHLFQVRE